MSTDYVKLSEQELQEAVSKLDGWQLDGDKLSKDFELPSFEAAMEFVTQVASKAKQIDHHPDIFNSYNKVNLTLQTHSAGEVTSKDIELAQAIDTI